MSETYCPPIHVSGILLMWAEDFGIPIECFKDKRLDWECQQRPMDAVGVHQAICSAHGLPWGLREKLYDPLTQLKFHMMIDQINPLLRTV